METNCTVYVEDAEFRAALGRVINPDDLSVVSVICPSSALKWFDGVEGTDENGKFRGLVPTKMITPDNGVEYIPYKYCLGNSVDVCPIGIGSFEWKEDSAGETT